MRNVDREAPALDVLVAELEARLMTIVRLVSTQRRSS